MKKMSFHRSIIAWFSLAFLVLLLIAYTNYRNFKQLTFEKEWVDHTYLVIDQLNGILSDLKDIQSSQRGYVITGQKDYLTPLALSIPRVEEKMETVSQLISDNALQMKRFSEVVREANARIKTAQEIIAAYDTKGQAEAFSLIKLGSGKKEMDELRIIIAEMVSEETHLLEMRKYNAAQTTLTTLKTGGGGIIICALILILVFWTIYRETEKRENTEASLQTALEHMEQSNNQTSLLGKLSDYLQSCQTTNEAFNVISASLPQLLNDSQGSVSLFRHSRNLIETMSKWGDAQDTIPASFNPDQCWGLRRGRAHYYVPGGTEPCCGHFGAEPIGPSLCIPMQAQGETIGLFSVAVDDISKTNREKVAFCRRVSEQISLAIANLNLQNRLREQSIRDPLTKLFNRRYLETTLERELSRAQRNKNDVSVLVLDIDYFKKFNDTMGHDAGDALLEQFARLLENNVRKEDIVCRYGGEEFVVVLPMANLEMGVMRALKICEATRKLQIKSTNKEITSVSVSIGVSSYPAHGKKGQELITAADTALYISKQMGRDRVTAASITEQEDII